MRTWYKQKISRQLLTIFYAIITLSILTSLAVYRYARNPGDGTDWPLWLLLGQIGLSVLAFFLVIKPMVVSLSNQLKELSVKSKRLAEGKSISLSHDVEMDDEVGDLTKAFNRMARSIEDQREELSRQNEQLEIKREELERILDQTKRSEMHLQDRNELIETLASKESLFDYSSVIGKIVKLTKTEFGALLLVKNGEITSVVPKEMTEEQQESLKTQSLLLKRVMMSKVTAESSKKVTDDLLLPHPYYINEAVIPVKNPSDDQLMACLYLARFDAPFDEDDIDELESYSKQIAISLMRMALYDQMKQERQETTQLLNSIREAILYVEQEEGRILGNRALLRMFANLETQEVEEQDEHSLALLEVSAEEIAGRVDQKESFLSYLEQVLSGETPRDLLSVTIDQGEYFLQIYAEEIERSDQQKGTMLVLRDVTAETEVDRMKSELVSTVSHELRTPLSSIYGFTELMLERDLNEERSTNYLKTIHSEAKRLTHLVNDFLDVQRMESGQQSYMIQKIDLLHIVQEASDFYGGSSSIHQLKIDADFDRSYEIEGDADSIRQLIGNLLSNAIKYSPEGGNVLTTIEHRRDRIAVSIRDHGIGIPTAAIPNLFNKFYRVDNSDSRKIGGTGLGLAICREIVRAHDGELSVTSTYGEGSTFSFELPVRQETEHTEELKTV
ncbi:ATP-binding protein [Exiguobacterium flavidum]|uniref:ATP-binding protein n=1 Tax=Exiguobacterium flavidum TaxID=2184695 RepID=UPI000DF827B5|nr:ATP-binding protein [Exiguobacterium flavidum]